jgi:hypothetical protein
MVVGLVNTYFYVLVSAITYKINTILTSMMEIAVNFTYKFESIVSASSILSLNYYAVFSVLCFSINLVVLKLEKG